MKYLGCAYYPEYWGRDRWETDARLMAEAGINLARIGEFAWVRMEPEEGKFTLGWLHESVETLARHGIDILMCTPTAAPPAWLTRQDLDVMVTRDDGLRVGHGHRRHYCSTSPSYRRHTARIVETLSREMSRHKNVVAWQLDNEFGPELAGWCRCNHCQERFRAWLRDRYGSIEQLNRRWGTGFWSQDYSDWRQIRLQDNRADLSPSHKLDCRRFWSDMMIEYARSQAEIIRRHHPGVPVTTNGMGPVYSALNYYKLFEFLDMACDDLYFDIGPMNENVMAMNVFRSLKPGRRYWVTETGAGALDHGKPPRPEQFRAWAWSNLAHGADAHIVFRWRTCPSGHVQELQGILEHSGAPRHRYRAVKTCFTEIQSLAPRLENLPLPEAPVAIVQDYDTLWGYESSRVGQDIGYLALLCRIHNEFYRRHIVTDFIPADRNLNGYRLIVLPSTLIIGADLALRLEEFVASGGTLLALGQIGLRDDCNNYLTEPGPQHLQNLLGVSLEGGMYLHSHVGPDEGLWTSRGHVKSQVRVPVAGKLGGKLLQDTAGTWIADLELGDGQTLMTFGAEAYKGQPAVVEKRTGRGSAVYAGVVNPGDRLFRALLDDALARAGIRAGPETPRNVEVTRRGRVTFAINHTGRPITVRLGGTGRALTGQFSKGVARLGAYGVAVVEKDEH